MAGKSAAFVAAVANARLRLLGVLLHNQRAVVEFVGQLLEAFSILFIDQFAYEGPDTGGTSAQISGCFPLAGQATVPFWQFDAPSNSLLRMRDGSGTV